MIATSPMFEGVLDTAKKYWFGNKDKPNAPDTRQRIVNAAKKTVGKEEGGVGSALRGMLNRRSMLSKAYGND